MYLPFKPTKGEALTLTINDLPVDPQIVGSSVISKRSKITWTPISSSEQTSWTSVAYAPSLSKFVAVASAGTNRVMYSTNGSSWTAASASEANAWASICWSPELAIFVAVAGTGTNRVMTSPDGINWTARTAASASGWTSVAWSPTLTLFVAVGSAGVVMTSPDGTTWTTRTGTFASNNINAVIWSSVFNLFIATGASATISIMTSPDGINWTSRSTPSATYQCLAESSTLNAIVVLSTSTTALISYDAINWIQVTVTSGSYKSIVWDSNAKTFVAVGSTGVFASTSTDGLSWRPEYPSETNGWNSIAYSSGLSKYVAVASTTITGSHQVMTGVVKADTITIYKDGGSGTPATNTFTNLGTINKTLALTTSEMNADIVVVYFHYISSQNVEAESSVIIYTGDGSSAGGATAAQVWAYATRTLTSDSGGGASLEDIKKAVNSAVIKFSSK